MRTAESFQLGSSGGKGQCVAVMSERVVEEFALDGGATEQVIYV